MTTDKKLIIALVVLLLLGGGWWWQKQKQTEDMKAHSLEGARESLPSLALSDEEVKKIDKIELDKPPDGDGGAREKIVLVKKGEEDWALEQPVPAKANASNVQSLVDNLKRLEVNEEIAPGKEAWEKFEVTDDKALHAVFYQGDKKALDLYLGENGSRGQMARVAGKDSVYALKGYSSFLYTRDASGWRDKTIFKFDEKNAVKVSIVNENGEFAFEKSGEEWEATHSKKPGKKGKEIEEFDKSKLESMLRAYKALNANDFADDEKPSDVGLDEPTATVTIEMKGDSAKYVLTVGDTAEGSNRWVMKNGSDQIFSVSSWSADWATADVEKFQKSAEDENKGDDESGAAPSMPTMPNMPTMPAHGPGQ